MARSLSERLAGLERSTGRDLAAQQADSGTQKVHRDVEPVLEPETVHAGQVQSSHPMSPPVHAELGKLGFVPGEENGYFVRVLRYDSLMRHGSRRFADVFQSDLTRLAKASKVGSVPARLVFYDTETTGLGTGAGTFPFLHALGQFEEDELVLYQYFLTDYGAEGAMLDAIHHRHFDFENTAVVTFNGKSFDWPLLKNRMILHRKSFSREPGQIDLLHPSRRLWKKSLDRVNLTGVENYVLGLTRTEDLPGKEAPARYFAYLEHRDPHLVEPVFEHNATDVCSLVSLTSVIADTLNGVLPVEHSSEYVALGRWFDEWQEHEQAERCFLAAATSTDADWTALWLYSLHSKRFGDWDEAVRTWLEMVERYPWSSLPLVELAKNAEHQQRDYSQAEKYTLEALERVRTTNRLVSNQLDKIAQALDYRLQRIRRKRSKRAEGC